MRRLSRWFLVVLLLPLSNVNAQDKDSLFLTSDSLLSFADSLSIFTLIDSLLSIEPVSGSQLAVRLSYNSNVLSAGRTLGIDQFGLTPGITYYHTSGLYADVSGYWSKDFTPGYYLTVLSAGYMKSFSKRFSIMAGYDRYFYNLPDGYDYVPYSNTLSITPIVDIKPLSVHLNYSFYFGDQTAHRILPGLSLTLEKKSLFKIDRIALSPSFYVLYGNEIITEIQYPDNLREIIRRIIRREPAYDITEKNVFGIMNYSFTIPLSLTHHNWSFMVGYTYNIPKALPGEALTLSETGFITGSVSYFLDLKGNKNPW